MREHELSLLIDNNQDYNYTDFDNFEETDLYPKIKEDKRVINPLLTFVAGAFLWYNPCDASQLKQSVLADSAFSISDYNTISNPLFNYPSEIEQKVFSRRFSKKMLLKEIFSFKSLVNNWDGYGSIPLEVESAANVIEVLELLGEDKYSSINDIFPNPNGTITVIWENYLGESISLEVGNNTFSYYVDLCSNETEFYDNNLINDIEINKLALFINKLA